MAANLKGMQIAQTMDGKNGKVRNHPSDTNIKQMAMGSWKANLAKGGQPFPPLKGKAGQGGNIERKK